jgi:hypothetical protein
VTTSAARGSSPVSSVPSPEAAELSADAIVSRLKTAAGVIAPTTVVSALLFWFGYVATLAQYQYFGVRLDLVNLSTPELLLSGVEALYVPVFADGGDEVAERVVGAGWPDVVVGKQGGRIEPRELGGRLLVGGGVGLVGHGGPPGCARPSPGQRRR